MTSAAAFFDLDRTLISGASAFPVGVEAWRQGLVSNADIARWGGAAISFLLIGDKGDNSSDELRSDFLTRIDGVSVASFDGLGSAVLPRLTSKVRPESRKLITMHHEANRDTYIVSASPDRIVAPLAASLSMTGAIGTKGEIIDGRYTGQLDGPFVYGQGKVESIENLVSDRGYDLELCYAYSDSISDLPMLEAVGHPVAVNPDSELESIAHERGWPIVIFARKTKQALAYGTAGAVTVVGAGAGYVLGRRHGRAVALAQIVQKELGV
ncbi:MAG: HAD-IB family hydrolase [Actinomycetota bacterium]|nr:HAD-IB family hydrolase [Actinomycetota bacterium]